MMIVLDTDHVSFLEWARGPEFEHLQERLARQTSPDVVTTIITYAEQTRGWLKYIRNAKTLIKEIDAYDKLVRHLEVYRRLRVLPFDEHAAAEYQRLQRLRLRIGTMDLKIASIIFSHDALLLSRNLQHFRHVPDLKVEDWTQEPRT